MKSAAFAAGFGMMTIELLAGRLIAPYLGSSLYTWTAVIAAVMAGYAAGYPTGGRLADRFRRLPVVGLILLSAGASVALSLFVASILGPVLSASGYAIELLTAIFAAAVFFPPAFLLSMVTPALLSQRLRDLKKTGETYGSLGAWNAAGSILGTYLSGFVFISFIGTRLVFLAIALLLTAFGVACCALRLKEQKTV